MCRSGRLRRRIIVMMIRFILVLVILMILIRLRVLADLRYSWVVNGRRVCICIRRLLLTSRLTLRRRFCVMLRMLLLGLCSRCVWWVLILRR